MAENKSLASPPETLASILAAVNVKKRFEEILGEKAASFTSSILSLYNASQQLKEADPGSILQAAVIAATLDLPINLNLGRAFIIPYGKKAQFQLGFKGFVELAIRTGQYRTINATEVYKDEIASWNPLTGILEATEQSTWKMREKADRRNIAGYMAYFKLLTGFEKTFFMTHEQLMAHGERYSKSFKNGLWTTDPHVMELKTVIKLLLSKWGILSIQMQKAIEVDQAVVETTGEISYEDRPEPELIAAKPTGADKKINEDQFKLLCARTTQSGINPEEIKDYIRTEFQLEHRHDLTIEQLSMTLKWLEKCEANAGKA